MSKTLPVPIIDAIRLEYARALNQLTTKFSTVEDLTSDEVLMTGTYIGLGDGASDLEVKPEMRAEDCLEEKLVNLLFRPRSIPYVVRYARNAKYSIEERKAIEESVKRAQREFVQSVYATELVMIGIHPLTAHALAMFIVVSDTVLIEHLKSLHPVQHN